MELVLAAVLIVFVPGVAVALLRVAERRSREEEKVADVCIRIEPIRLRLVVVSRLSARILVPAADLPLQAASAVALRDDLPEHVRLRAYGYFLGATCAVRDGLAIPWVRGKLQPGVGRDAALILVAELARRGMDGIHALRELPSAEYEPTFEIRARDGGGARTVAWTEIAPSERTWPLPPPLVRDGNTLLYHFDSVDTEPARLVAAAELLRITAASLRAERYG